MNISEDPKPAIKEALKRANESAKDIEAVLDHIENLERANEQQQITIDRQLKRNQELTRINQSHLTRIASQEEFMEKRLDAIDRLQKENICLLEKLKGKEKLMKRWRQAYNGMAVAAKGEVLTDTTINHPDQVEGNLRRAKTLADKVKELKTRIQQGVPYNEHYFDFVAEVCELIRHKPLGHSFDRVVKEKVVAALKAVLDAKTITKNVLQEVEFRPASAFVVPGSSYSNSYEFVKWLCDFLGHEIGSGGYFTFDEVNKLRTRVKAAWRHTQEMEADHKRLREALEGRNAAISKLEVEIGVANGNLDFNRRLAALQKFLLKCLRPFIPEETYKHYYELAKKEYPLLPGDDRD